MGAEAPPWWGAEEFVRICCVSPHVPGFLADLDGISIGLDSCTQHPAGEGSTHMSSESSTRIDLAKRDLRKQMRSMLASIGPDDRQARSAEACQRLAALPWFQRSAVIMLYMPLPSEVDLTPAAVRCFQDRQTVCVPSVDWDRSEMRPVEITTFDDEAMDIDDRGIRTPADGRPLPLDIIDLIVIPGLAFDTEGWRLGRGGGYYDRFLSRVDRRTRLVGVCFDQQIVDEVPHDVHDAPMQMVVTDRRTARCHTPWARSAAE